MEYSSGSNKAVDAAMEWLAAAEPSREASTKVFGNKDPTCSTLVAGMAAIASAAILAGWQRHHIWLIRASPSSGLFGHLCVGIQDHTKVPSK